MLLRRLAFLICCAVVTSAAVPGVAMAQDCLNGLKPALVSGRFTGSLDCGRDRIAIRKVGTLRGRSQALAVYDYRYKLAPACNGCAIHGGQRVLIFSRGRYLGQYKPDGARVTIRNGRLLFWPLPSAGALQKPASVDLASRGVPRKILVGGEVLGFGR